MRLSWYPTITRAVCLILLDTVWSSYEFKRVQHYFENKRVLDEIYRPIEIELGLFSDEQLEAVCFGEKKRPHVSPETEKFLHSVLDEIFSYA